MTNRERHPMVGKTLGLTLLLGIILAGTPGIARAGLITDPAGDFIPTFTGRQNPDLDVVAAEVRFDATNFYLHAVLNGPVGTTSGGIYVWGFNRGNGIPGFASIGRPGVLFDRVIVLNNNDTSPTAGVTVTHSGNEIFATVPRSLAAMAPNGFAQENFTWNIWPRDPTGGGGVPAPVGNFQISDFAPDNSNALVQAVPEPGSLVLLGMGTLGLAGYGWRRRNQRVANG